MGRLQGKTALITGGSSGIGLATARLFRAEGAQLAITGVDADSLERAREELGSDTLVVRSDAGNLAEIDALMAQVKSRFDRLDILFLNAGVWRPVPIADVSEAQYDETMDINCKGVFFAIQKALPLFGDSASVIVHTSIHNQKASPHYCIYAASKAALRSLVKSLSHGLIGRGIRVNAISPGPIMTPMFAGLAEDRLKGIADKSPIKRFGNADEVAKVALFLASDDSSYVVGEEIVVDGGYSML